jgi:MFS-type transporter involved in bile tolerance (Atg22 family)
MVHADGEDLDQEFEHPAPFLGAWRFTGDFGNALGPLLVAVIKGVSIALAAGTMGVLGLVGTGILLRYVPRYAPHVPRDQR